MSPARIPEGSVFVARQAGVNVALQLLEAAAEVGADRNLSVRTTTGGYHVFEEVAERYQANLGEDAAAAKAEKKAAKEAKKAAKAEKEAAKAEKEAETAGNDGGNGGDGNDGGEELEPLPVTAESTVAEIDAYAAEQSPPVDLSTAKNRVEKIALLEAARAPKTPDAE